jgi:hypothetical protein
MRHVRVTEDCWSWRHSVNSENTPRMRVAGREIPAVHLAWFLTYREWPVLARRERVARQCGTRLCVRPRHLAILTVAEIFALRSARLDLVLDRRCLHCEVAFRTSRSHVERGRGLYCSRRCVFA